MVAGGGRGSAGRQGGRGGHPAGWVLARGGGTAAAGRWGAGIREGGRAGPEPGQPRCPPAGGSGHGRSTPLGPGPADALVARPARLGRAGVRGRGRGAAGPALAAWRAPPGPGDGRRHGPGAHPDPGRDHLDRRPPPGQLRSWRRLAAAHAAGDDDLRGLDPWAARQLDRLADLEAGWPAATEGPTLLHCDLRADNLLLTPTRVLAVDWPGACAGAAWVDLLLMLPSVAMQGGPDPEPTFAAHPAATGADPRAVTTTLAAMAGFLIG